MKLSKSKGKLVIGLVILLTVSRGFQLHILTNKVIEAQHRYQNFSELVVHMRSLEAITSTEAYRKLSPDYLDNQQALSKVSGMPSDFHDMKLVGILPNSVKYEYRVKNPNVSADRIFYVKATLGILKITDIEFGEVTKWK